jgi:GxxExxY protein
VYEVCLAHDLKKRGLQVERQKAVAVEYDSITFEEGFRADLIVDGKVVLELKAVEELHRVHKKQLLTYLRLMDKRLGLLINFDSELIKDGIVRVANGLPEDQ